VNLTAHTITDAQIRDLARGALTAAQHKDCTIALRARREMLTSITSTLSHTYPTTRQRLAARARCAAILNARSRS
jgi:small-conductance mechanosensitive channel